jgi:hypothetical protein
MLRDELLELLLIFTYLSLLASQEWQQQMVDAFSVFHSLYDMEFW